MIRFHLLTLGIREAFCRADGPVLGTRSVVDITKEEVDSALLLLQKEHYRFTVCIIKDRLSLTRGVGEHTLRSIPRFPQQLAVRQLRIHRTSYDDDSKKRTHNRGRIASYQWKGPFELLEMESSGAFRYQWWAM